MLNMPFLTYKEIVPMDSYYDSKDLPKFPEIAKEAPELGKKFFEYYSAVFSEGDLTEREKALIALAVAHTIQCPYCIDAYTQACLEKGSNLSEMTEAVHVAVAIRGGASLVHGLQMRNIADKISM
jgi:alkylhydroperoxidase/carboxymuconolactone decarboxylase family protein